MSFFICPVCSEELNINNNSLMCSNNHFFDLSKYGYVNLLMSQKISVKRHGDDKLMVRCRRDFLDKDYYLPLANQVIGEVQKYAYYGCKILDVGCGEGYYTQKVVNYLKENEIHSQIGGVDISKDALAYASKRSKDLKLAVASSFKLPVADNSCDVVLNLFAPFSQQEFHRVLKPNGVLIRAIPLEHHLWGFKEKIYDLPYENKIDSFEIDGFRLVDKSEIKYTLHIDNNEDIQNLFKMTPYYYKTSIEDQQKINALNALDTEIEFCVPVYKKV